MFISHMVLGKLSQAVPDRKHIHHIHLAEFGKKITLNIMMLCQIAFVCLRVKIVTAGFAEVFSFAAVVFFVLMY